MNWMRVGAAALVAGACSLLLACGSGVVSDFDFQKGTQLQSDPASDKGRIIVLGDDFSDIGQGNILSVRDGSNNWVQQLAGHYGVKLVAARNGGWAYAQGSARINAADPENGAPSVKQQVDQLLSDAGGKLRKADMVFINGGMHDIIDAVESGGVEDKQTREAILNAADALVEQVKRVVKAGAGHVAVTGVYDLGTTPWAVDWGGRAEPKGSSELTGLVVGLKSDFPGFNGRLLTELNEQAVNALYLDAALFFKFVYDDDKRNSYPATKVEKPACPDPELMQGCDKSAAPTDYNTYLFADDIHFTPNIWRWFGRDDVGENAYQRVADRWGNP